MVAGLPGFHAWASEPPRGNLLELHSCELYAGGCVVSSEATLGGRYMLQVWQFTGGSFAESPFAGLQVAVLQTSSENLANVGAWAGQAVAYLPETASPRQREALMIWLRSTQPGLKEAQMRTRVVPLRVGQEGPSYTFSAGDYVKVQTAPLETCETGACGEALWYNPRTSTGPFTVAVDRSSSVKEPMLKLHWLDAGKRSVFLAKFGDQVAAKNLYVSAAELCGPSGRLF